MTLQADWFVSFRSPYTYLSEARVLALTQKYDLDIALRPVLPIAVRDPGFFEKVNPKWLLYVMHDTKRLAEQLGIAFRWPQPDPVIMNNQTREISPDQPYIRPVSYLGVEAARRGRGVPFFHEAMGVIWNGGVSDWHESDHMAGAARRAGLDLAEMQTAIAGNETDYEAELADNLAALDSAGHWGVPTLVFKGEPFFGQDRIATFEWRLAEHGLSERA